MAGRKLRRTPYLSGYLKRLKEEEEQTGLRMPGCYGSLIGAAIFLPSTFFLGKLLGPFFGLLGGVAIAAASGFLATSVFERMRRRNLPSSLRMRAWSAGEEVRRLQAGRKLHKWMDPSVVHLLEAGAYHWTRVHTALATPAWQQAGLARHWTTVREQARQAAHDAMAELLVLSMSAISPPERDKEDELKDVIDDFLDLDIADALQGLKQIVRTDSAEWSTPSSHARLVFEQGRAIAERLQRLADEVEQARVDVGQVGSPELGPESTQSIDIVLGELRAIRQAETELEQRT